MNSPKSSAARDARTLRLADLATELRFAGDGLGAL
jgi:hypothetical protein